MNNGRFGFGFLMLICITSIGLLILPFTTIGKKTTTIVDGVVAVEQSQKPENFKQILIVKDIHNIFYNIKYQEGYKINDSIKIKIYKLEPLIGDDKYIIDISRK